MLVEFKDVTTVKKFVGVEIPADVVGKEVSRITQEFMRHARIPGFRKGKVPTHVVRQRFEADIKGELLERLLPQYFREAIDEKGLEAIGSPELKHVGEIEDGNPLRFDAEFEIRPVIELGDYKGLEVEGMGTEITPEEVEQTITQLRDRAGNFRPITDRPAQDDDHVVVDIVSSGEGVERQTNNDYDVHLSDDAPLAELREAVTGKNAGDEVSFEKAWDDEAPNEAVQGKTIKYDVTIKEVRIREIPELDDAFAKSTNFAESVDELRTKIETDLKAHREQEAQTSLRRQLGEKLTEGHDFEVPEALVIEESAEALRNYARMLANQGIDPEKAPVDWENLRDEFRPEAVKRVKLASILLTIADKEALTVSDDDVDEEIKKAGYNQSEFAGLKRRLIEDGTYENLRHQLQENKAFDLVSSEAKITMK